VEDNAFGLLRFAGGAIASFHTSWSQWQNRFEWQIGGTEGAIEVAGLGGSYGEPRLALHHRRPGRAPRIERETYPGDDRSWTDEWSHWLDSLASGARPEGCADDALVVMEVVDALYRAARAGRALPVGSGDR
jgi:predicted dehydrogenase